MAVSNLTCCYNEMSDKSFNCIRIDSRALQTNYALIRKMAGDRVQVMAMVKADAYGHGMIMAARAFARAGCTIFGVAELREGVELRQAGIVGDIFVTIGFAAEGAELLFQYDLTPVIYSFESAQILAEKARELGREIGVHVKVDSGMSRLGILPEDLSPFLDAVSTLPGLRIAGIMSHFPESDNPGAESTEKGFAAFSAACRTIKNSGSHICHIANSGAVLNFPDTCCDMVRAGIALYGYLPEGRPTPASTGKIELVPAMSFVSRVLQVKTLPAGTGVSYGYTFRTRQPMQIAVIPVGYEDGYSRALSNRGEVLIHGRRVPVRGRVCMNMCMVEVTGVEGVRAGDEVVLLGRQNDAVITADDLAEAMGSISYEVLCLLGNNNKREYIE